MASAPLRPLPNALWDHLREAEDIGSRPGDMTLRALIARLFLATHEDVITALHRQLTLHGLSHGEAVVGHASQIAYKAGLLNPHNDYCLSPAEIYLLIAASYLHDIGMGVLLKEDQAEAKTRREHINEIVRLHHHERSEKYITDHSSELYLDSAQSKILGLLCRSHRKSEHLGSTPYHSQPWAFGQRVRLALLAAILRIADEMDLDHSRASEKLRELWDRTEWFDPISRIHWLKHFYTLGTTVKAEIVGSEVVIRPLVTIRVPGGFQKEYYSTKIRGLISEHLHQEIESVRTVSTPGFSFGGPEFSEEEQLDLPRYFLRRNEVNVLLIDDENGYVRLVKPELDRLYRSVDVAQSAEEAFAAITPHPDLYHVAVVDLDMPGLSGSREIDAGIVVITIFSQVLPRTAILANTGMPGDDWRTKADNAGAHKFRRKATRGMVKEAEDLSQAIEQVLEQLGYQLE